MSAESFNNLLNCYFQACKDDLTQSSCNASGTLDRQYERSVFLEDPLGVFQSISSPDEAVDAGSKIAARLVAMSPMKSPFPQHVKPVNYITGKLPNLIDVRVTVVQRIESTEYQSPSVANWSFFIVADATGSIVAGFPPELPRQVQKHPRFLLLSAGGTKQVSMADMISPGNVIVLYAAKSMSMFGTTMLTFSKQSRLAILGSFVTDYSIDFTSRKG